MESQHHLILAEHSPFQLLEIPGEQTLFIDKSSSLLLELGNSSYKMWESRSGNHTALPLYKYSIHTKESMHSLKKKTDERPCAHHPKSEVEHYKYPVPPKNSESQHDDSIHTLP